MATDPTYNEVWAHDAGNNPRLRDTQFIDMRVETFATKLGGAADPDWVQFKTDGGGSSGVYTWRFDKLLDEELFFEVQLPHGYVPGSSVRPHVHWCPIDTGAGAVVWGLEYTWQNIGQVFGNTTVITVTDPSDQVAFKHQIAGFDAIAGANKTLSSMILCRLFRNGSATADDLDSDACLLAVDFHVEVDSLGSYDEWVK